jgi:hypothetical protein
MATTRSWGLISACCNEVCIRLSMNKPSLTYQLPDSNERSAKQVNRQSNAQLPSAFQYFSLFLLWHKERNSLLHVRDHAERGEWCSSRLQFEKHSFRISLEAVTYILVVFLVSAGECRYIIWIRPIPCPSKSLYSHCTWQSSIPTWRYAFSVDVTYQSIRNVFPIFCVRLQSHWPELLHVSSQSQYVTKHGARPRHSSSG